MSRLIAKLDRFWFADAPAARLAMLRILAGSYAAWLLRFRYGDILESAQLPASQFQPVGVASIFAAPPSSQIVQALLIVAMLASVPFVLGLAYRVTGPLFAVLLLCVLTYYASWGSVNHPDALVTAHIFILGLVRAADAVSLDALIRAARRSLSGRSAHALPDPAGAWQYGFAVKLLCAATATSYFLAGIAKVAGPNGWGWASGEVLLRQVAWDGLRKELLGQPPPPQAAFLYEHAWLFALLAVGSLVVELGAPLALLDRRIGYVWALAALPMHWGIYFVMGIQFRYYLSGVAYAPFFPLERVPIPFRRSIGAALEGIATRIAGVRVPRPALPGWLVPSRPLAVSAVALLCAGGALAAGIVAAGGLPREPAMSSAPVTQSSRRSEAATPRRTPTPASLPTATEDSGGLACLEPCDLFQVVWVGDILLGNLTQEYLDRHGQAWPFEYIRQLLKADFVIGNHEAPITERQENYFPNMKWTYHALPASAKGLADAGFHALGLSNNHVLDRGPEGLADTLRHVREAGMRPFGAGLDDREAAAPLLISTPHGALGVVALGEAWQQGAVAGPGQAGTVPLRDDNIANAAESARADGARWVVGFVHWGANYAGVTARQRRLAATFARSGYDLVIGHHPHVAQEIDVIDGMPVLYSLGNFAFGSPGRYSDQTPGLSAVARTFLGPDGFRAVQLTCIVTDNAIVHFQPRPCSASQAKTMFRGFGPHVTVTDGKGIVEWRRGGS